MTSRRPTLTDVAARSGVSLKTVSRVINGVETVSPELAARVHAAVEALGYRHNRMAAMLRSGRSEMIGVIIRDMTNPFYSSLAAGAADVAEQHRTLVFTAASDGDPAREQALLEQMLDRRVDGVILTPADSPNPTLKGEAAGTPMVAVDVSAQGVDLDLVAFDNVADTRRAMTAAIEAGHRRFAMILDSYELRTMEARAAGAHEALAAAGLELDPELVRPGHHTIEAAARVAAELLDRADPPDAVFCANNIAALGVASEIRRRRARTAIVAFDDFPLSSTLPNPVFCVVHDPRQMGATAARLLFDRIADPDREVRRETMPTTLTIHEGLTL